MRVSVEAIYPPPSRQGRGGLRPELIPALRSDRVAPPGAHEGRERQAGQRLGDSQPIAKRPPEAADRAVPGRWAGDLIMGAFDRSATVTLVERRSRLVPRGELPRGPGAQEVYACLRGLCADLPAVTRRRIT